MAGAIRPGRFEREGKMVGIEDAQTPRRSRRRAVLQGPRLLEMFDAQIREGVPDRVHGRRQCSVKDSGLYFSNGSTQVEESERSRALDFRR